MTERTDAPSSQVTVFVCGPKNGCEHDYSGWQDITDSAGKVVGGTAVCVKCGYTAYEEDMWR